MDWDAFITYVQSQETSPVLGSILLNTKLGSIDSSNLVIVCENLGGKIFLDGRRALLEGYVSAFSEKNLAVSFTVKERKRKKKTTSSEAIEPAPTLMDYSNNVASIKKRVGIQERFTFENFAVSASNHIAHAAAQAVAQNPGNIYNPLFIYGTVGVGKTHLSHAIANHILDENSEKRVLYCTSEQFTNDLVDSIRVKNTKDQRKKYRNLDLLVIDDVQFIAGKSYVQEEFYHTFNTIVQNGGQIILISDRPPKEIKELEDRLRSRFSGGLILDIQRPDFELRTAIVLIKAQERNIDIDIDAAKEIAERVTDSRELEGTLLRLLSVSLMESQSNKVTLETTHGELKERAARTVANSSPQDIIKNVCSYYHIKPVDIKGSSRKQEFAVARQVAMYILRVKMAMNLDDVAYALKRKDHTTIMHGVEKIKEKMLEDDRFKEQVEKIVDFSLST